MSTKPLSVPVETAVLITIIGETVLQERIVNLIKTLGATGYTITPAQGVGRHGSRLGDIAGYNTNIEIKVIVSSRLADAVLLGLIEFQKKHALIAFRQDIEVLF